MICGFGGIVLEFFDVLALFGWHKQCAEEGDKENDGYAEASFKSEVATVKDCSDVRLRACEYRVEFDEAADVHSEHVALTEVPDGMDRSDRPYTASLKHKYACENSEEEDVEEGDKVEACIAEVEE